ncbi:hypothetical protein [Sediminicoccus rosea]|uniref:Uncharacterized protein n=1 Tax=Sediminicoccus rosea TaxID=1225128 RepID=A0ABZ0PE54_9PROT|nr:hypothetical protein [Sediminicoccus rosea]WPB83881.1 hypothetical protein R9Z33_17405 [Sediminicoccus rosea]
MTNAVYSFLPWYRRGLGGLIGGPLPAGALRPSVQVGLQVSAEPVAGGAPLTSTVTKGVTLYGPGDVVGIEPRAIIRRDPNHWVTNAEPNYLAQVEFYDEDLPWRYSPEGPTHGGLRLAPWIALVVLAETEFEEGSDLAGRPLAYVHAASFDPFPPARELWAWAHVQVNASLAGSEAEFVSPEMAAVLPRLAALLAADPDVAMSRLVCPRRLQPNTAYHAFLMPAYETGRLAGLGATGAVPSGTTSAWEAYAGRPEPLLMPFYHRWFFRTAETGDFETLVRKLKAANIDPRVGYRDMDVLRPGLNLPAINRLQLGGVLKLGGALRAPDSVLDAPSLARRRTFEAWDAPAPQPFQTALAGLINLADDYLRKAAPDAHDDTANAAGLDLGAVAEDGTDEDVSPDPVVVPPLYGRWHAAVDRLLATATGAPLPHTDNWVHGLNLDPRHRVAAAAGTTVIQQGQEEYMDAAWEQVGDVVKANRKLRNTRYAIEVSEAWFLRRFVAAAAKPDRFLRLTRPAQRRLRSGGRTARAAVDASRLGAGLLSAAASRALRPGGRLFRLASREKRLDAGEMLARLNDGALHIVPPKAPPRGLPTLDILAEKSVPGLLARLRFQRQRNRGGLALAKLLADAEASAERFAAIPKLATIAIGEPGAEPRDGKRGAREETQRLVEAAAAWFDLVAASHAAAKREPRAALDLGGLVGDITSALQPRVTLRARALHGLSIPPRILAALPEEFDEIMHHPVIDTPMYKPLEKVSKEFLMPGLSLVKQNSITAVVTNQAFIEAYMVGLNHEFARELLWREYPTDQRGSVFRQFWDVRGQVAPPGTDTEAFRESLRDIPKIHTWPRRSRLGTHDNRENPARQGENLVLLIRGELLKKYPNAVIYAHRAVWDVDASGRPDPTRERRLLDVPESALADPPRDAMRFPLFEAQVEPDITFFGFDLDEEEAKGRVAGPATTDNAGWFFVLKERPGEPRFGFDPQRTGALQTVNDIVWTDLIPSGSTRQFIDPAVTIPALAPLGAADMEKARQREDDGKVLAAGISAARWAYLLYQAPVMVAIHAAEMLKRS